MQTTFRMTTRILPGGRIEITDAQWQPDQEVEVIVLLPDKTSSHPTLWHALHRIQEVGKTWDRETHGELPLPDAQAVNNACRWLEKLHHLLQTEGQALSTPHVSADEEGNIVFEWWQAEKKLTLYITPTSSEYVRVWGLNPATEMEEGHADTDAKCLHLWNWLLEERPQ